MATAEELFRGPVTALPRLGLDADPYGHQLEAALAEFTAAVAQISGQDRVSLELISRLPSILQLGAELVSAHRETVAGRLASAYTHMTYAMKAVSKELSVLRSKPMAATDIGPLFRARHAAVGDAIDRGGLFHIPFDKRHRVAPMRYSSLGVPMLYLGSSLYVCWEEMGRPDFDSLWVASLRLTDGERVRVLDLGWRPGIVAEHLRLTASSSPGNALQEVALARAVLWPLQAACSYRKRFPGSAFVEEYVIPQLLTRHLIETGEFDGIRYFSNHVDSRGQSLIPEAMNFVFPAVPTGDAGYSHHLRRIFEITTPIPWSLVTALGPGLSRPQPIPRADLGVVEIIHEHPVEYSTTDFAKVEGHLLAQQFGSVV